LEISLKKNIYKLLSAARFSTALFLFIVSTSLAQVNQSIDEQFKLAQSYEQAGLFSKAEEIYRQIYIREPNNFQLYEPLNRVLVSQRKYNESIELLQSKIIQSPKDYNLYGQLGVTYYLMEKTKSAEEIWEKGIATDPSSYIPYRVMANYAIECRAFETAIELLNRGEKNAPDPTLFSMDIANLYIIFMKFEKAAVEFCNLIEFHPEQVAVVKSRINSYLSKPDALDETINVVKKFIDSKPRLEIYDLLTFIYQASGNYEEAFQSVISLEKKFNSNGMYIFTFAQEAFRNQKYDWTSNAYNEIIKNHTNSPYFQTAKIGYARTLEAALDQKYFQQNESWKPIVLPRQSFVNEYMNIISAYNDLANEFPNNAVNLEVLFRIAQIYGERIFDYQQADIFYKKVIQISPQSIYAVQSNISLGIIFIKKSNLEQAKGFFQQALAINAIELGDRSRANFFLAYIEFWKSNFLSSLDLLKIVGMNPTTDYTNDALELSTLITSTKKDSLNLVRYAKADLLLLQNKYKEAGTELKTLSDDNNLFIINDFAKIKLAELFVAENNYSEAVKILEDLSENKKSSLFVEKSTFLLAECFQYGINNFEKAVKIYQNLLETFPNSLYFDRAREALNSIQTKNGKK
jgi:tetratricopeptide (TPR) repeat protein